MKALAVILAARQLASLAADCNWGIKQQFSL
jgi:hypothetical protein